MRKAAQSAKSCKKCEKLHKVRKAAQSAKSCTKCEKLQKVRKAAKSAKSCTKCEKLHKVRKAAKSAENCTKCKKLHKVWKAAQIAQNCTNRTSLRFQNERQKTHPTGRTHEKPQIAPPSTRWKGLTPPYLAWLCPRGRKSRKSQPLSILKLKTSLCVMPPRGKSDHALRSR